MAGAVRCFVTSIWHSSCCGKRYCYILELPDAMSRTAIVEAKRPMDAIRRLFGGVIDPEPEQRPASRRPGRNQTDLSEDERALERYRYLLRTAPPETLEQAHAEAFAQLTPEQRRMVLQGLTEDLPESERAAAVSAQDDPRALARVATRAEMRQPGTLERRFGGMGGPGIDMGGMMAGSFLSTIAGVMVGSAIANAFFNDTGYTDGGGDAAGGEDTAADGGDTGADGGFDDFGGDFGGDIGGDFGGGGEF